MADILMLDLFLGEADPTNPEWLFDYWEADLLWQSRTSLQIMHHLWGMWDGTRQGWEASISADDAVEVRVKWTMYGADAGVAVMMAEGEVGACLLIGGEGECEEAVAEFERMIREVGKGALPAGEQQKEGVRERLNRTTKRPVVVKANWVASPRARHGIELMQMCVAVSFFSACGVV